MTKACKIHAARETECVSDSKSASNLGKKAAVPNTELTDKHEIRMYMGWCNVLSRKIATIISALKNTIAQYRINPKMKKAYLMYPIFPNNIK